MPFNAIKIFPALANHILPITLGLMSCFVLVACSTIIYFNKKYINRSKVIHLQGVSQFLVDVLRAPTLFLFGVYGIFAAVYGVYYFYKFNPNLIQYSIIALGVLEFITYFWATFNFLKVSNNRILRWSAETNHPTLNIILPYVEKSLDTVLFLIMINLLIPILNLSGQAGLIVDRAAQVFLIGMIGFFFYELVNIFEKLITSRYIANNNDIYSARKINTQLLVLKRFIIVLIIIITAASILMLFDKVNSIGKGLLTTAGVVGAIGAFASQQSLSRIFAGLQIAFAQPVRIGDTVIVDNEFGTIEEITLLYIVVKLWDLRRLILPSDYFTSKGMQNLTRQSSQLLGTIFIYTDYTLPVDKVRAKYLELLEHSPLWDKKVAALHVTNINEKAMELRGLMSAANASQLWELRCSMREQLIQYIVETYPWCLSQSRNLNNTTDPTANMEPIGNPT